MFIQVHVYSDTHIIVYFTSMYTHLYKHTLAQYGQSIAYTSNEPYSIPRIDTIHVHVHVLVHGDMYMYMATI